jgi:hypothetical protein
MFFCTFSRYFFLCRQFRRQFCVFCCVPLHIVGTLLALYQRAEQRTGNSLLCSFFCAILCVLCLVHAVLCTVLCVVYLVQAVSCSSCGIVCLVQAVLCRRDPTTHKYRAIPLSVDHNPSAYEERMRIQKAGGNVRSELLYLLIFFPSIGDLHVNDLTYFLHLCALYV